MLVSEYFCEYISTLDLEKILSFPKLSIYIYIYKFIYWELILFNDNKENMFMHDIKSRQKNHNELY